MGSIEDAVELCNDYTKESLEEVIKNEQFKDYNLDVTLGSGKGDNYLGILRRIKVRGLKKNGEEGTLDLIMKLPLQSVTLREKFPISNLYKREVKAYTDILPLLSEFEEQFNIPKKDRFKYVKCYKADGEELKEFLILKDMKSYGYEMSNRKLSLSIHQMRIAIKALANLHALSFVLKQKQPQEYEELTKDLLHPVSGDKEFSYFLDMLRDRALAVITDPVCKEALESFGKDLYDKMEYFLCPGTADPYNVICHGDCWVNNMLFKFDNGLPVDICLLDWQIMRHTSPVTDIAYLIFTSTDEELRRNHYEELIDLYYESLKSRIDLMGFNIEDVYPLSIFRDHLKLIMPFGLLMALMIIPMIVSEVEDTMDMEELLGKEKIDMNDIKYESEDSANRYETRIQGVVSDYVRMNLI